MKTSEIITKTEAHIKSMLEGEGSGHDWWHIDRVRRTALHIARREQADMAIVELGALLHDIADHKFHGGNTDIGHQTARAWLESVSADESVIEHVTGIVQHISFKGAGVATPMPTLEGSVVQDADRLDAMGAIGIARCFAYGGFKGRELYNPNRPPNRHDTFEAFKSDDGPSLNHFYEKLLLLKDRMNTDTGRAMAVARHEFMESYLRQFYAEWDGKE